MTRLEAPEIRGYRWTAHFSRTTAACRIRSATVSAGAAAVSNVRPGRGPAGPRLAVVHWHLARGTGYPSRIRARVANRGEFPTHVSNRGRGLRRLQGVRVEFHPAESVRLLSEAGHRVLGHLGGVTDGRDLEWFVSAEVDTPVLCELRALGGAGGNVSLSVAPSD